MEIDFREIRSLQRRLDQAAGPKFDRYMRRAFNSTVRASKTEAKRAIGKRYNLPAKRIDKGLKLAKVIPSEFRFSIQGDRQPVSLTSFNSTKQLKRNGVSFKLLRAGARKRNQKGFIAAGLAGDRVGGNRLAFVRVPGKRRTMKAGRYRGKVRQVIKSLKGPSVGAMLEDTGTVDHIVTFAAGKYAAELDRLIKVAIKYG